MLCERPKVHFGGTQEWTFQDTDTQLNHKSLTKEMTKDSNLRASRVKEPNAFNKQPVEIYFFIFQFFTNLPTTLCTENSCNESYPQPCVYSPGLTLLGTTGCNRG